MSPLRRLLALTGVAAPRVSPRWLREQERRDTVDLPIIAVWRSPKEIAAMARRDRLKRIAALRADQAERRRA